MMEVTSLKKIDNIEVPANIKLMISLPGLTVSQAEEFARVFKEKKSDEIVITNYKFRVVAQTTDTLVLEGSI